MRARYADCRRCDRAEETTEGSFYPPPVAAIRGLELNLRDFIVKVRNLVPQLVPLSLSLSVLLLLLLVTLVLFQCKGRDRSGDTVNNEARSLDIASFRARTRHAALLRRNSSEMVQGRATLSLLGIKSWYPHGMGHLPGT